MYIYIYVQMRTHTHNMYIYIYLCIYIYTVYTRIRVCACQQSSFQRGGQAKFEGHGLNSYWYLRTSQHPAGRDLKRRSPWRLATLAKGKWQKFWRCNTAIQQLHNALYEWMPILGGWEHVTKQPKRLCLKLPKKTNFVSFFDSVIFTLRATHFHGRVKRINEVNFIGFLVRTLWLPPYNCSGRHKH